MWFLSFRKIIAMISGNHCDRSSMSLQSFPELFTIIFPNHCNHFFNTSYLFPKWAWQHGKSTLKAVFFHQNAQNPRSFFKCYFVRLLLCVSYIFTLFSEAIAMKFLLRKQISSIPVTLYFLNSARMPTIYVFCILSRNIGFS